MQLYQPYYHMLENRPIDSAFDTCSRRSQRCTPLRLGYFNQCFEYLEEAGGSCQGVRTICGTGTLLASLLPCNRTKESVTFKEQVTHLSLLFICRPVI
jgi:hypothetical protein